MLQTAESVCMGHPDKLCDFIADSILDNCLLYDTNSRVACEVLATKGHIILAGEITCQETMDIETVTKQALKESGYNPDDFTITSYIHEQSPDIAAGVNTSLEARAGDRSFGILLGAGDQGTAYGYATDETESHLPLALDLAHKLSERIDCLRQEGVIQGIYSDGKTQVSLQYEEGKVSHVDAIVISVQHAADKPLDQLRSELLKEVIQPLFKSYLVDERTEILINPSGRFVTGGPNADTGLTGRKIMVDTYGGLAPHGGGAFSGKDPSKVDRSGAYMARYIAKNYVNAGICKECTVALSYAIGKADPVMVHVTSHGTSHYSDEVLSSFTQNHFNLRPSAIIDFLNLRYIQYQQTARYGHFTSFTYPWERTFNSYKLKKELSEYGNQKYKTV